MSVSYVYALIDLPPRTRRARLRSLRVAGRRIRLVPVGPLYAAVEQLDEPPALTEASLRAQHRVVFELARRFDATLPARFGAAVDIPQLERLVAFRRATIRRAFDAVRGREQMTVRILGPEPQRRGTANARETGTAYLRSRGAAAKVPLPRAAERIRRSVKSIVVRERLDAGRGSVRATLHHLIQRGRAGEYRSLIEEALRHRHPLRSEVMVSGPWPAFAFTPDFFP